MVTKVSNNVHGAIEQGGWVAASRASGTSLIELAVSQGDVGDEECQSVHLSEAEAIVLRDALSALIGQT